MTNYLSGPTPEQHQAFLNCVAGLATAHHFYLEDSGRTISECYTLEMKERSVTLRINADVPFDLFDEIHQCFKRCFE